MVVSFPPSLRTAALACSARRVDSRAFCTPCSVHLHSETYVGIGQSTSRSQSMPIGGRLQVRSDDGRGGSVFDYGLEVDGDAAAEGGAGVEEEGDEEGGEGAGHGAEREEAGEEGGEYERERRVPGA